MQWEKSLMLEQKMHGFESIRHDWRATWPALPFRPPKHSTRTRVERKRRIERFGGDRRARGAEIRLIALRATSHGRMGRM